ncbi:hypothetical protein JKP76_03340 [Blastococcus sp. TML/C7B]|uniref:glycosyl hydrolase family 28-related protein n=1 Tax=Blastococcus sp. TML/C7B TaxID=2798728 RepID=UPI00190C156D|nr:glycosyl hydrolase family 28-related protein [Blastococcus sp. TML/C7B]MBN1095152.1 hypothetical protein [Blastococcus sp. TML/C7B]
MAEDRPEPPAPPGSVPRRRWRTLWALGLALVAGLGIIWAVVATGGDGAPAGPGQEAPPAAEGGGVPPGAVDVRDFGATGDGVTDDAPAIRQALESADAVHLSAGTYLLGSYATPRTTVIDADFVFRLRDGQTVTADPGAVLRMADGVIADSSAEWGGNVFLAEGTRDVTLSGFTLDLNGPGNLVPAGRTITAYGLYTFGADQVTVQDVTMVDTPGQNYVVAQGGGSGFEVRDSTFRNGGTSIPGNEDQIDFSALYFTGTDVVVDGITVEHDQQPFTYSGGVELHGPRQSLTNSRISDSWPAVYIGPDVYSDLALQDGITVEANQFLDVGRGVVFNAGGTGAIDDVSITGNLFRLADFAGFEGEPTRGIDQDMPPDGRWTYHHIITGLTIGENRFQADGSRSDAIVRLSQVHSATIEGNRFDDIAGTVIALNSSPWDTKNVLIADNDIGWRSAEGAPAIALSLDGSSTSPPKDAFDARDIVVSGNRLDLHWPQSRACAVHANWSDGATVSGISLRGNDFDDAERVTCGPRGGELSVQP